MANMGPNILMAMMSVMNALPLDNTAHVTSTDMLSIDTVCMMEMLLDS